MDTWRWPACNWSQRRVYNNISNNENNSSNKSKYIKNCKQQSSNFGRGGLSPVDQSGNSTFKRFLEQRNYGVFYGEK